MSNFDTITEEVAIIGHRAA